MMIFTHFFVFVPLAAQFLLLLYLIGLQQSHCEQYLIKTQEATITCDVSTKCWHLCYQEEEHQFNKVLLKSKHALENQKHKRKSNRSIALVKFIKKSKWINLKNSKRSSEPPFKTAAVRNLEPLKAFERMFSLKLNYSIYTLVIFWLLPWTHTKTKHHHVLPTSFRGATSQVT